VPAAAIKTNASMLVTTNVRDSPPEDLPKGIEANG